MKSENFKLGNMEIKNVISDLEEKKELISRLSELDLKEKLLMLSRK